MLAAVNQNSSSNDYQGQVQLLGYCVQGQTEEKKNTKVLQGIFVFQERNCEIGEG